MPEEKKQAEQAEGALVVPALTTQTWYPRVLQLLTRATKLMLSTAEMELVVHQSVHKAHTMRGKLKLIVCHLSGDTMKSKVFRSTLPRYCSTRGDPLLKSNTQFISRNGLYSLVNSSQITAYSPTLMDVLELLHTQLHLSYSALNTARSALSCVISIDKVPVGQHPSVCRFVKGSFERKRPSGKYYAIWDVLNFLKAMSPNSSLSQMELSLRLSMLLALVSIQRKQTLLQLNINNEYLKKSAEEFVFILSRHVKQSRPNYSVPPVIIPRYALDTKVCPYVCLEDYIERTKSLRHDDVLLVSTINLTGQSVPRH